MRDPHAEPTVKQDVIAEDQPLIVIHLQRLLLPVSLLMVIVTYLITASYVRPGRIGLATVFNGRQRATWGAGFQVVDRAGGPAARQMREFAAGRKGFIVWESRRPSGTYELKYRIWKRNLDGSGLAMISGRPSSAGYSHLGPRISPSGRRVVFAGKAWDLRGEVPSHRLLFGGAYIAPPYDAWLVDVDRDTLTAGPPRELLCLRGLLGTAGQDRFFEWKDDRTVYVNIPSQKGVFEVDVIEDRIGRKVLSGVHGQRLLSAGGRYVFCAAPGGAGFYRIDRDPPEPVFRQRTLLQGCQPVMSSQDDFLIWMRAPGHVGVFDLKADRTLSSDGRAGRDLGLGQVIRRGHPPYHHCYFPAMSRDRSIVVCGASRFPRGVGPERRWLRHSHKGADYEIFAFHFDPKTLTAVGPAVRYSYNEHSAYPDIVADHDPDAALRLGHALDRWPDVWVENRAFETRRPDKGETPLQRARRLETLDPPEALRTYRGLAKAHPDTEAGRRAAARAKELTDDPSFCKELRAWDILESMRRAAAGIEAPGAAPHGAGSGALAPEHVAARRAIHAAYSRLIETYPATRAVLEARRLVRQWGIDVPKHVLPSEKVLAQVEAVATRVSQPLTVREAYPYTQAFLTAEFKVRKVLAGRLDASTIIVVLMSMDDGRDLPAAAYRTGSVCRLRLGDWDEQTHFHKHKMADDLMELDATHYFAFTSRPAGR